MQIKPATRQGVIPLTKGHVALVDADDYKALTNHKWSADPIHRTIYAVRLDHGRKIYMHREILGFPPARVDHRNRNGANSRH